MELNEKQKYSFSLLDPNISFSGGTGGFTRTKTLEVSETNTISVEHYVGVTAGLQGVVNIGGSGFQLDTNMPLKKDLEKLPLRQTPQPMHWHILCRCQRRDKFNVDVFRDPMFGIRFQIKEAPSAAVLTKVGTKEINPG